MGGEGALGGVLSGLITSGGVGPLRIPSCANVQDAHENKILRVVNIKIALFVIEHSPIIIL